VADTVVAVIGLALGVQIQRRFGTIDLKDLATLKG
jgi:NADH:ubiquinone oxidoreductase subunit K